MKRDTMGADARRAAIRATAATVVAGREAYDRDRHLPRIVPVAPEEVADRSPAGRAAILRKLARALRAERRRGRAGHWTYDLNRHIALRQAYAAEWRGQSAHPSGAVSARTKKDAGQAGALDAIIGGNG